MALLGEHPEGLSAEAIRVHLDASKPIGDMLQGMKRLGDVTTHRKGKALRYKLHEKDREQDRSMEW